MVMADINIINEIKALCEKMDAQSRETLVISVGRAERNVLCHGSKLGHQFLLNDKQVCQRFVKFCEDVFSGAVAIEDNLDGEESIPVTTIDQILSSVVEGIQQYDRVIYKSRDITPENKTGRKSARCSASPKKVKIGAQENLSMTSRITHQKKQTAMKYHLYMDDGDRGVTRRSDEDEDDNTDGDEYTLEASAEIEFKCEICSKILRTKASLSRHQLLHSEKMESCKVCNKKFYRAEDVTKHMKVHQSTNDKEKEKTSCHLCNRNFQRASSLKLHMKSAHKSDDCKVKGQTKQKKQFICNVCNVEFRHKFGLDRHMKSHENIRLFKCYVCNESFGTEKELQAHASSHQVMLISKCVLCGSVLPTDEELKEHQMNSCSKNPHKNENNTATSQLTGCHSDSGVVSENPISEQVTVSDHFDNTGEKLGNMTPEKSESSAGHIPSEEDNLFAAREDTEIESLGKSTVPQSHNPNGHKCDICNRCFKQPLALYKHKLHHDNFGMFSCRFCDYVTKSKDNLNRHSKKHLDVKPHTCSVCSKGFTEKHNLRLHMLTHTKERPHLCDICGKGFRTAQLLKRHKRVHTGERPYVCKQCGKSFMTAEVLRNHENIHNNFRGYICDVCGVAFNQKCSLYTHKHKHADKPSHICKECGKGCSSAASLKTHFVSKHLKSEDVGSYGLKVYECDKCHKLFADKSDLNIHLRTHTGEKPFKCTYCEKAFADKSNLRTHEKIHLDVRPFSCDMCGKGFILKRDLLKHMKSHPNVEVQTQINRYHIEQSTLPIEEPGTILNPQISTLLQALPSYTEL